MSVPTTLPPKPTHTAPQPPRPNKAAPMPKKKREHIPQQNSKDVFDDDMTVVMEERQTTQRKRTVPGDNFEPLANSCGQFVKLDGYSHPTNTQRSESLSFKKPDRLGEGNSPTKGVLRSTVTMGHRSPRDSTGEQTGLAPSRAAPRPVKHVLQQGAAKSFSPSNSSIPEDLPSSPIKLRDELSLAAPPPPQRMKQSTNSISGTSSLQQPAKTQVIMSNQMASSPTSYTSPRSFGSLNSPSQLNVVTPPSNPSTSANISPPPPLSPRSNVVLATAPPTSMRSSIPVAAPPPPSKTLPIAAPPPPVSLKATAPPTLSAQHPQTKGVGQLKTDTLTNSLNLKPVLSPRTPRETMVRITFMDRFNTQLPHRFVKKPFDIPNICDITRSEERDEELIKLLDNFEGTAIEIEKEEEIWNEFGLEEICGVEYDTLICVKGNCTDLLGTCCIGDSILVSY